MITEKLYYKDSHIKAFTAKVIDCRKNENGFEVILDKTAFFPEGGGQYADTGKIGEADINDVQKNSAVKSTGNSVFGVCRTIRVSILFPVSCISFTAMRMSAFISATT